MTDKSKHLLNHKKITMEHCDINSKEYDKQFAHFKNVMTVKDLKEILNSIPDDSVPVIIESFEDAFTAVDNPLLIAEQAESFSTDNDELSLQYFCLKTVNNTHYSKWKKEHNS